MIEKKSFQFKYTSRLVCIFLIGTLAWGIAWFGYQFSKINSENQKDIIAIKNALGELKEYAQIPKDEKEQSNIKIVLEQIDRESDAVESWELLSTIQEQNAQSSQEISNQLMIFSIIITIVVLAIPIFNYVFIQKDQVLMLRKIHKEQIVKIQTTQKIQNLKFKKQFGNFESRFDNEIDRLNKSIDQIVFVNQVISEDIDNNTTEKVQPISESEIDIARAYYLESTLLYRQKRYSEAIERILKAIDHDQNPRYYYSLSKMNYIQQNYTEALTYSEIATNKESNNALYNDIRGMTLFKLKRYKEALMFVSKAVNSEPNNAIFCMNKALILDRLKNYNEAFKYWEKVIDLEPENTKFQIAYAASLIRLKIFDEAIELLDQIVLTDEDESAYSLRALAKTRLALENKDSVIDSSIENDLEKAALLNSKGWENYLYIAESLLILKKIKIEQNYIVKKEENQRIKLMIDKADYLSDKNPEVSHFFALYYESIGDGKNAIIYHKLAEKYGYLKEPN